KAAAKKAPKPKAEKPAAPPAKPEPTRKKKAAKKTAKKVAKKTTGKAALATVEQVGDGSNAVVVDATQLDAEIAAIKEAQDRGTESLFEIGHRMLRIRSQGLHALRVDAAGKPKYKKWED